MTAGRDPQANGAESREPEADLAGLAHALAQLAAAWWRVNGGEARRGDHPTQERVASASRALDSSVSAPSRVPRGADTAR